MPQSFAFAKVRRIAIAVVLGGLVGAAPVPAVQDPQQSGAAALTPDGRPPFAAGRLLVRLTPDVALALDRVAPRAALPAPLAGGPLGDLNRRFGLAAVRPLRAADALLDSVAARRTAEMARRSRGRAAAPGGPAPAAGPSFASTYVFEFDLPPDTDLVELAAAYARDSHVAWAQPDWIRHVQVEPNDHYLATTGTWGQPFADLWGLRRIAAPAAWDLTRGAGVVVAISDTGVDPTHPDLAANLWSNPGEIAGNGVDDDSNGFVDDLHGWNFVTNQADFTDDHGHGTHVAGTVAAVGQNGVGVVGVAYEARVMAVKGLAANGTGLDSGLAAGIVYAVENGARVINASWGGLSGGGGVLHDAVELAHAAGVVFVAAAGNSAQEVDYAPFVRIEPFWRTFPAAYRQAITVGAVTQSDTLAYFSNYGAKIDVVAPGGGDLPPPGTFSERSILSLKAQRAGSAMTGDGDLVVGGNYLRQAGTSMAAPHVSGVAALVVARHPEFDVEQVRQALRHGADDVGLPGIDLQVGYGRLNAAGTLAVQAPLVAHIASPMNHGRFADGIPVSGSAFGPGFASYTLECAPGTAPDAWVVAVGPVTTPVVDGSLGTIPIDAVGDGELRVRLRVVNATGDAFEDRVLEFLDRVEITGPPSYSRWRDGTLDVTGTIAPPDLVAYAVEWRAVGTTAWRADGVALVGGGTERVVDGVLATLDLAALPDPVRFEMRTQITTAGGTLTEAIDNLVRDTSVRPGWPRHFMSDPQRRYGVRGRGTPALADLDGDGTTEILIAVQRFDVPEQVHVLEPDGSERPGWPQDVPLVYSGPSAGDLDGDGLLEVVVPGFHEVFVFRHDGTPLPGWPRHFDDVRGVLATIADVDGDGMREIVFRSGTPVTTGPRINAVRADGSQLPGFPASIAGKKATFAAEFLAVGDVDGDGSTDIAAVRNELASGGWAYYSGLFLPPKSRWRVGLALLDAQGRLKPRWPKSVATESVTWPWFKHVWSVPLVADLDADGVQDVAVGSTQLGRITAFRGNGQKLSGSIRLPVPNTKRVKKDDRHDPLVAADVTGDGVPELLVSTDAGQDTNIGFPHDAVDWLGVLRRAPAWTSLPGWPRSYTYLGSVPKDHGAGSPSVADIDGDGDQDLVLSLLHCDWWRLLPYNCNGLWAFEADGSVVPGFPKLTQSPGTPLSQPAIGDLDGDGLQEIVWLGESGELVVWNVPGTPGTPHHEWPMTGQNAAHTGALPVAP
jgi:subtilisin family serine protease